MKFWGIKIKALKFICKVVAGVAAVITALSVSLYFFSDQIPTALDKYFYRSSVWDGNWSSNTEYTIAPGLSDYVSPDSPKIIIRLKSDAERGTVQGNIISEGLCELQPITWIFYFDSKKPNFLSFGRTRDFQVSYLREGIKVPIALVRAEIQESVEDLQILVLSLIGPHVGTAFPQVVGVAKNLNAFDEDVEYLDERCADIKARFYKSLADHWNKDKSKERQKDDR